MHLGEVQYGNIGSKDRLDFTVVGPAGNEVSWIEAMCRPLGNARAPEELLTLMPPEASEED